MGGLIGIGLILGMVFGGYTLAGGKMAIILHSLPFEMMMIGGAATGAFVVSNDFGTIKHTLHDIVKAFKGAHWKHSDYVDVLCLLLGLLKVARADPMALEAHIEQPQESDLFKKYPRILADEVAVDLITDTLRAATMNYDDPHQVDDSLSGELDKRLVEAQHSAHALQNMADALPALGIVAAVLGVIKTMSSIDQPPEVLGQMIGGALVGTFLGVFLAYGFVGPLAARIKGINEEDHRFYTLISDVLVAHLHKHAPQSCVEVGRRNIPRKLRPTFNELEAALKGKPMPAGAAA
ncbi:MAG: flagellar motor stator protein MotA [Alphaproteobacteria bacterium]|nr:flagellar motor stator protein MotA [Alphaproteobacteria bacterium]MDX5369964.1 flagellar motor stator protein MotA [Alphaproteobacteria bacterium]MDX5464539.1 flagellar motor stator protein MotA [Alphaproteobacteria bacterium]